VRDAWSDLPPDPRLPFTAGRWPRPRHLLERHRRRLQITTHRKDTASTKRW